VVVVVDVVVVVVVVVDDVGGGEPVDVAVQDTGPHGHLGSIGSSPETVPDALLGLSKLPDNVKVLLVYENDPFATGSVTKIVILPPVVDLVQPPPQS
jgi:hypothetical protein